MRLLRKDEIVNIFRKHVPEAEVKGLEKYEIRPLVMREVEEAEAFDVVGAPPEKVLKKVSGWRQLLKVSINDITKHYQITHDICPTKSVYISDWIEELGVKYIGALGVGY
ncbi:MAG: hypothetical protein DRJ62_08035 [Thermoprotei archaeon]|nr:MAG: hypothetical protein DRJ62_08035 [Thermoprotei archaeon]